MPIKLINLTKKYSDFVAVDNLNIEFEDHKLTILIGPSAPKPAKPSEVR